MRPSEAATLPSRSTCPIGRVQAAPDLEGPQFGSFHLILPTLSGPFAQAR